MIRLHRSKPLALSAVAVLGAAGLLTWSQPWFEITFAPGSSLEQQVTVAGDAAAPALVPLSLAALALTAALAIAKPLVRIVLSLLLSALGVGLAVVAAGALADPLGAAATSVIASTGLDGDAAVESAVSTLDVTLWPAAAIAVGALLGALGIALAFLSRGWRGDSGRHEARVDTSAAASEPASSPVSDWDSLSSGDDPTSPAGSR